MANTSLECSTRCDTPRPLAAGNSLMYVQRQLGHADIGTTERYYGHLERHVLAAGAVATEEAIARAATTLSRTAAPVQNF